MSEKKNVPSLEHVVGSVSNEGKPITPEHPAWTLFEACGMFGRELVDEGEDKPKH